MDKIRVAAIQPRFLETPREYSIASGDIRNKYQEIVEKHVNNQLAVTLKLLERAGEEKADIVTTCEDTADLGGYMYDISGDSFTTLIDMSQPLVEDGLSKIAKKYSMYIVGCYYKKIEGKYYNSGTIFDRNGHITGEYKKTHITANEKWKCTEGENIEVFELDFGKIGVAICYDMMFQEVVEVLALKGAKVVFHPTLGYGWYDSIGEATLRTRANDNSVYIVTAKNYLFNCAGKSSIIDFWGHVRADAGFYENTVVFYDIDLKQRKTQPAMHMSSQTTGISEVDVRKLAERRPELYSAISSETADRLKLLSPEQRQEVVRKMNHGMLHW